MLEGSILQKLETAHQGTERPLNFGVYYKNTLVALCHALEDFVFEAESSPLMITAFQQGKWYLQEADRYGEIAENADFIALMAAPDTGWAKHPTSQKENVSLVSLDTKDPVAQEWHLMILSPRYSAMVLCQELSPEDYGKQGQPKEDLERKFYGFWTFEPNLVKETVEIAIAHIGNYNTELQQQLQAKVDQMGALDNGTAKVGEVVQRVVQYLQDSQESLESPHEDASYLPSADALDDNLISNELQAFLRVAQINDQADINNPKAAAEVAALSEAMGQLLDLPAWQMKRLQLSSFLHRLVPSLGIVSTQKSEAPSCPLVPGMQALRAMPRVRAVAQIITHYQEHWDGSGVPGGLSYDRIPLESRILGLIAHFQERVNTIRTQTEPTPSRTEALSQALTDCQHKAGTHFDPKLVETLAVLVMGMQQGMDLEANQPKIAAGMWLLTPRAEATTSVVSS
jgi:DICT domain-containing protein